MIFPLKKNTKSFVALFKITKFDFIVNSTKNNIFQNSSQKKIPVPKTPPCLAHFELFEWLSSVSKCCSTLPPKFLKCSKKNWPLLKCSRTNFSSARIVWIEHSFINAHYFAATYIKLLALAEKTAMLACSHLPYLLPVIEELCNSSANPS